MAVSLWNRFKQALGGIGKGDNWQRIWDARQAGLAVVLGESMDMVYHSPNPFYLGGNADVLAFGNYVPGVTYVTADLTGEDSDQIPNDISQYELMMCLREGADWAPELLSYLARYTLEAQLNPGETMDWPNTGDSKIKALIFALPEPVHIFHIEDLPASLLLGVGITAEELDCQRNDGSAALLTRLKDAGIFPYTALDRDSIM